MNALQSTLTLQATPARTPRSAKAVLALLELSLIHI